jgi:hypothetical protein
MGAVQSQKFHGLGVYHFNHFGAIRIGGFPCFFHQILLLLKNTAIWVIQQAQTKEKFR